MPQENRTIAFHYLIRAAIVLGFSILITHLIKTGDIILYIAPKMQMIVKLSAIGLYCIGIYLLFSALKHFWSRETPECECEQIPSASFLKHAMIYGLFIFPLLLGFLLPNVTMGTALAAKKGMNLSTASTNRVLPAQTEANPSQQQSVLQDAANNPNTNMTEEQLDSMFESDIYNEDFARLAKQLYQQEIIQITDDLYMEILTAIDLFLDQFVGRTVEIGGFVYREPDMTEKQFVIGRFAMECCSADAIPYGVLAEHEHANRYHNDTWIKIRGKIDKTIYNGYEIMLFLPDTIQLMEVPESPYVYPNYNF